MSNYRFSQAHDDLPDVFPFPKGGHEPSPRSLSDCVLDGLESVSRRIDDLARELNCLGFFEEDDRPRAA